MTQEKTPVRRLSFSVSATSILTLVVLVIAAMTCAYIWGVMTGRASDTRRQHTAQVQSVSKKKAEDPGAILKAHELEFTQVLRSEKPARDASPIPVPEAPKEPAQDKNEATAAQAPAMPEDDAQDPDALHDYVFQMAALRDEQAVDSLRQKLEGFGLRTRMEQSGKVFIILVALRGNAARAAEIYRIAGDLRLGTPLVRSKKTVAP